MTDFGSPLGRGFLILLRSVAGLVLAAVMVWPADWAVWEMRGEGAAGQVVVSRFTVASLKGGKEEYYFEGKGPVDCSRSLFAHGGNETCRSLEKKPLLIEQY